MSKGETIPSLDSKTVSSIIDYNSILRFRKHPNDKQIKKTSRLFYEEQTWGTEHGDIKAVDFGGQPRYKMEGCEEDCAKI